MIGPIPNSLGAGAYNGSFFPHGLVTFSTRGLIFPDVFQEVCLPAVLHPVVALDSQILQDLPVDATLHQSIATPAVLHETIAADAEILRDLQLDAIIEECD